ncbi:hypothetical protein PHMEG_0006788 [Phytophthora megakarya]|uniref:Uncharacterized protein n=1 Tax=Phytophthora megakarya TaxID=4795 RepID=A0A225WP01_9STRA|nr:hypothetical protein PHMEG_0006788 [Phytophthora megakarya]
MAHVRVFLGYVKAEYPVMGGYLKAGAKIGHTHVFPSVIVKTINDQALTNTEKGKLVELIPPTSNVVERLLSQCNLTLTPQWSCIMPTNVEILALLLVYMDMWNASTVVSVKDEVSSY